MNLDVKWIDIYIMNSSVKSDNEWKVGDIIYRIVLKSGYIEPYEIQRLHRNYCNVLVADIIGLFNGFSFPMCISDDKNRIVEFTDVIYGSDIDKLYNIYLRKRAE